jgi:signal transduction histidine kinase
MLRDRQRLATELHDSVAQMLFTIGVAARYARQKDDPAALTAALEEIESTAAQARRELRASLRRLSRPNEGVLDKLNASSRLEAVVRAIGTGLI